MAFAHNVPERPVLDSSLEKCRYSCRPSGSIGAHRAGMRSCVSHPFLPRMLRPPEFRSPQGSARGSTSTEQTEPTDEVEPDAVYHCPQPQVLGMPQRPGVRAQEIALENAAIPGTEPSWQ